MQYIDQLINQIPLQTEAVIWILRFGGAGFAIIAIFLMFRALFLCNSLSVAKARQILEEKKQLALQPEQSSISKMPELILHEEPAPQKTKRPLIIADIPSEAQVLLNKIALPISLEDGWQGAPQNSP